jgi:hypothetical protein
MSTAERRVFRRVVRGGGVGGLRFGGGLRGRGGGLHQQTGLAGQAFEAVPARRAEIAAHAVEILGLFIARQDAQRKRTGRHAHQHGQHAQAVLPGAAHQPVRVRARFQAGQIQNAEAFVRQADALRLAIAETPQHQHADFVFLQGTRRGPADFLEAFGGIRRHGIRRTQHRAGLGFQIVHHPRREAGFQVAGRGQREHAAFRRRRRQHRRHQPAQQENCFLHETPFRPSILSGAYSPGRGNPQLVSGNPPDRRRGSMGVGTPSRPPSAIHRPPPSKKL